MIIHVPVFNHNTHVQCPSFQLPVLHKSNFSATNCIGLQDDYWLDRNCLFVARSFGIRFWFYLFDGIRSGKSIEEARCVTNKGDLGRCYSVYDCKNDETKQWCCSVTGLPLLFAAVSSGVYVRALFSRMFHLH